MNSSGALTDVFRHGHFHSAQRLDQPALPRRACTKTGMASNPEGNQTADELLSLRSRMRIHEIGPDNTLRRPPASMADAAFHRAPAFRAAPIVHSAPVFYPTRALHPAHYFNWDPLSAIQWELWAQSTWPDAEGILAVVGTDEQDTGRLV